MICINWICFSFRWFPPNAKCIIRNATGWSSTGRWSDAWNIWRGSRGLLHRRASRRWRGRYSLNFHRDFYPCILSWLFPNSNQRVLWRCKYCCYVVVCMWFCASLRASRVKWFGTLLLSWVHGRHREPHEGHSRYSRSCWRCSWYILNLNNSDFPWWAMHRIYGMIVNKTLQMQTHLIITVSVISELSI